VDLETAKYTSDGNKKGQPLDTKNVRIVSFWGNGNQYIMVTDMYLTNNSDYSREEPGIKGDVNGDGIVNGTDIQAVINFIVASEFDEKADVNKDGMVNGTDIQEIINIIVAQD
jgi:hypothetical protein